MRCILCQGDTEEFMNFRDARYLKCKSCKSIMMDPDDYISSKKEKERYEEHNNDVNDKRYQGFVYPIVESVLKDYNKTDKGLDFGAGTGPVITKLLRDNKYDIKIYDPFFANKKYKLEEKYDYIVCCEVAEHFHQPRVEFEILRNMLNPGGSLYIMTNIYDEEIDFKSWFYKNDETHVFFYHRNALEYIRDRYDFSNMEIVDDMIIYRV